MAVTTETFESYRPLLFSIAYRMTGSATDAEDIVQDTYLRYRTAHQDDIRDLKPFLTTITTRLALDYLKSARVQREQYIGTWLPEPLLTADTTLAPAETVEQRESLSLAFLTLLETLTPPERAVFLLREVFDYSYDEIGTMLDKTPASCRQLFHRAQTRLATGQHRFTASQDEQLALLQRFLHASQEGDVDTLAAALAQDVTVWSDGGGKVPAALRPIVGVQAAIRLCIALARKADTQPEPVTITSEEINGSPALMVWMGEKLDMVISLGITSGHIGAVYVMRSPDKLAYLQRQLRQRHAPAT